MSDRFIARLTQEQWNRVFRGLMSTEVMSDRDLIGEIQAQLVKENHE